MPVNQKNEQDVTWDRDQILEFEGFIPEKQKVTTYTVEAQACGEAQITITTCECRQTRVERSNKPHILHGVKC